MARLPDLEQFAVTHNLKIATIADLIQYRLRYDSLVHHVDEARLPTRFGGDFTAHVFTSDVDDQEHLVLVKGKISPEEPVLVRAHTEYVFGDVFGYSAANTSALLQRSMELIEAEGKGVVLYLRQEGQGAQLLRDKERSGKRSAAASESETDPGSQPIDFRDYGIGAQILRSLGVRKMRLLTNSPRRLVSLPGYGLEVVDCVPLSDTEPNAATAAKKKTTRSRQSRASA
jgi:3,4-dihydroxy 2-butanone 4-phosphate synthase/GTP cyclohydrolase II